MLRAEGLSEAPLSLYADGHRPQGPVGESAKWAGPLAGGHQVGPRALVLLVQVLGHDVAADVGRLDAPVGGIPEDDGERDGRVVGRRVPDEPAVAEGAVVGLRVQRPRLAGDLDGEVALA